MEGFTHATFRDLMAGMGGLGIVCTEFVRVTGAPPGRRSLRAIVSKAALPLSVQVMGRDAGRLAEAAEIVCDAGADVVDLNLGCPTPRAVRGGVGAAMLRDPELLEEVVSRMRERVPVALSAKMRAGFEDAERVLEIAERIERAGADFVTVHPRKRSDHFRGVADWRIVRDVRRHLSIPVVGNGDCWYTSDVERMRRETGCDGVMVGRPAVRNPWIFRQAQEIEEGRPPFRPSGADLVGFAIRLSEALRGHFGENPAARLGKLKEWLRFAARALPDREPVLAEALRIREVDAFLDLLDRRVGSRPPEALDLLADGPLGFENSGAAASRAPVG